jgi:hypothetical protein
MMNDVVILQFLRAEHRVDIKRRLFIIVLIFFLERNLKHQR